MTSLNLRQNNIGVVGKEFDYSIFIIKRCAHSFLGGEQLVDAMKKNRTLRVLVIADNKISGEVAAALAGRLKGNTKDVASSFRAKELTVPFIHQEKVRRKGKHD